MDDTERRTAKRSRFDQTEPEPKRASRFDRRSRSPPAKKAEVRRSRSPVARDSGSPATGEKGGLDPAAAAGELARCFEKKRYKADTYFIAAAAARINAQIQAKKGVQNVDDSPIRSTLSPPTTGAPKSVSPGAGNSASTVNGDMYIADGDYIRDIEVNDLRNRYTLTKGSTQKMVNTPCVNISTDIRLCLIRSSILISSPSFVTSSCVEFSSLPEALIALTAISSMATADSRCVTSRSKKRPVLVRYCPHLRFEIVFILTFKDVTTRGNYYPDKSMATAAVCKTSPFFFRELY
jgi:hypothetical protein